MSHEVETMAYTNEVPWHGLGEYIEKAPNIEEMLKIAGIDWTVSKKPLQAIIDDAGNTVDLKRDFALVRDSDNKVLDVVGTQYTPIQNHEAFSFFNEFVKAGDATMETAGSLRGGNYVWGLANLRSSFKLAGGDEVKGYLLVGSPHQAGKSFIIKFTTVRVVCNNTLTLALRKSGSKAATEFRMAHRKEFDETMIEKAKETLGIARDQMSEFERNAKLLKKQKMTRQDTIRVLQPIFQPQTDLNDLLADFDKHSNPRLERIMGATLNAPGHDEKTAWGVLNGVTYYADHMASRTADKRLTNAWLGKTANQKEKVLHALLDIAA